MEAHVFDRKKSLFQASGYGRGCNEQGASVAFTKVKDRIAE